MTSLADAAAEARRLIAALQQKQSGADDERTPYMAIVDDVSGALVMIHDISAATAGTQKIARAAGPLVEPNDVGIAVPLRGGGIVFVKTGDTKLPALQVWPWYYNGTLNTSTHFSQEQRVAQSGTVTRLDAYVKTAPAGQDVIAALVWNGVPLFNVTVADGQTSGATSPLLFSVTAGDILAMNISQVGTTNHGANLTVNVTFQPDAR